MTRILDEAEAMTPGISRARILRAWGGVRPLYDPGQRGARSQAHVHGARSCRRADGIEGLVSVLGGKLTTYRLMAEKVSDAVCAKLGVTRALLDGDDRAAACSRAASRSSHHLRDRLGELEHGDNPGELICECEIVTKPQIVAALQARRSRRTERSAPRSAAGDGAVSGRVLRLSRGGYPPRSSARYAGAYDRAAERICRAAFRRHEAAAVGA